MANLTTYYANRAIDHNLRNQAYTPPTTLYLGLFTVSPTISGGGTEVSGGAYARQVIALSAAVGGATSNPSDITFPTPSANWGTVTHAAVFDAVSGGNMLLFGSLVFPKVVIAGAVFKVLTGDFDFSLV